MWIYKPLTAVDYNYVAKLDARNAVIAVCVSGDVITNISVEYDWQPRSPEFDDVSSPVIRGRFGSWSGCSAARIRDMYRFGSKIGGEMHYSQQVRVKTRWEHLETDSAWEFRPELSIPEPWYSALAQLKNTAPHLERRIHWCLQKMQAAGPKF